MVAAATPELYCLQHLKQLLLYHVSVTLSEIGSKPLAFWQQEEESGDAVKASAGREPRKIPEVSHPYCSHRKSFFFNVI